jgi:hypothetical protein
LKEGARMRYRSIHLLLTVVGAAGIAAVYLPFTWDVSPMMAMREEMLWMLAWPFFLPIAIAAASARWLISRSLSKPEAAIAYIASGSAAGIMLAFIGRFLFEDNGGPVRSADWLAVSMTIVILVLGTCLLITTWRTLKRPDFRPLLALQVAYVGNAAFCLIEFLDFPGWQAGAYVVLVTVIAYLLQIILVYPQTHRLAKPH